MNNEKKRILDMLQEGKITAEEAYLLMDQVEDMPPPPSPPAPPVYNPAQSGTHVHTSDEKMLRIRVIAKDEDSDSPVNVEVNLPMKAARIAGNLVTKVMPSQARDALDEEGIDLSDIDFNELIDALSETGGDIVNVTHEGEDGRVMVRIYVE